MSKRLLKNKEEFESLKASHENRNHGNGSPIVHWCLAEPEQYPCVCLYEYRYVSNGPDEYEADYCYLSDFAE